MESGGFEGAALAAGSSVRETLWTMTDERAGNDPAAPFKGFLIPIISMNGDALPYAKVTVG